MDKSTEHLVIERIDVEYVFLRNNEADVLETLIFPHQDSVRNEFSVTRHYKARKPEKIGHGSFKNDKLWLVGDTPNEMRRDELTDVLHKISEESQKAFTNQRNSLLHASHVGFDKIRFVTVWLRDSHHFMSLETENAVRELFFEGYPQMSTIYGCSSVGFYDPKVLSDFVPSIDANEILKRGSII